MIVSCNSCGLKMTKEDNEMKHKNVEAEIDNLCDKWSGKCPNNCNDNVQFENIKTHLYECPNRSINCQLTDIGYNSIMTNALSNNLQINTIQHQILMINEINRLKIENDNTKQSFESNSRQLTQEIKSLKQLNSELIIIFERYLQNQIENNAILGNIKSDFNNIKQSISDSLVNNESDINLTGGEVTWNIANIRQKINNAKLGIQTQIISDSFYISKPGYKLCLKSYPNGEGCGSNNYLSIYFVIMKGDYDNDLSWPFKQKIIMSVLHNNLTSNVKYCMKSINNGFCYMKPIDKLNVGSGQPRFIKQTDILNSNDYLHNGSMKVKLKIAPY